MSYLKRFLAITLAIAMVLGGMLSMTAWAADDEDDAADAAATETAAAVPISAPVSADTRTKLQKAIDLLYELEIAKGVSVRQGDDDYDFFGGDQNVTRQQFALFTARINTAKPDAFLPIPGIYPAFSDVTDSTYFAAVNHCYTEGIIRGRTETTFDPEATITLQEAAAMLLRSLGWNITSFAAEYAKAFEDHVKLVGDKAEFPMVDRIQPNTTLTRNDMAMLLYNYLFADVRTLELTYVAGVAQAREVFTPVLKMFGRGNTWTREAYITGVLDWSIDLRVPIPGQVRYRTWDPIALYGSPVIPDNDSINLYDRDHNVRLSWVWVSPNPIRYDKIPPYVRDDSYDRFDGDDKFIESFVFMDVGTLAGHGAWSFTQTYALKDLGLEEYNDYIKSAEILGLKILLTFDRVGNSDILVDAKLVGEKQAVEPTVAQTANVAWCNDCGAEIVVSGFTLPYPVDGALNPVATFWDVLRTDSLYVYNDDYRGLNLVSASRVRGVGIPDNQILPHRSYWSFRNAADMARLNLARFGTDVFDDNMGSNSLGCNHAHANNAQWVDLVKKNNNGQKYILELVHNGTYGTATAVSQEFYYVYRPWRVGVRTNDATHADWAGARFTNHANEKLDWEIGRNQGEWWNGRTNPENGFEWARVAWAVEGNQYFVPDEGVELDGAADIGKAFFYEIRGNALTRTRQLLVHEKLESIDSSALTGAQNNWAYFVEDSKYPDGSTLRSVTFNPSLARFALSGARIGIAGTGTSERGPILEAESGSTYRLFYTSTMAVGANRFAVARRLTAVPGPSYDPSEYVVVINDANANIWNIPLRNSAGTFIGSGSYAQVIDAKTGMSKQILIATVNDKSGATVSGDNGKGDLRIRKGDRLRLVSQTFEGAWHVVRENFTKSGATDNAESAKESDYRPGIGGDLLARFSQNRDINSTQGEAREYTFGNWCGTWRPYGADRPALNASFGNAAMNTAYLTTVGGRTLIRQKPETPQGEPENRAIIGAETRLIMYTDRCNTAAGLNADTTGTAAVIKGIAPIVNYLNQILDKPGNEYNLRVVATLPVPGEKNLTSALNPATAGEAMYIFIDTTKDWNLIAPAAPTFTYGLVGSHAAHWFMGAPLNGVTPIRYRAGTLMVYNQVTGVLEAREVCWPDSQSDTLARGAFAAIIENEVRWDDTYINFNEDKGIFRPIIRFIDDAVCASKGDNLVTATTIDVAGFAFPGNDNRVSRYVGEIRSYENKNIMVLNDLPDPTSSNPYTVDLRLLENKFNFIMRDIAEVAKADVERIIRLMDGDGNYSLNNDHSWWYGSFNNHNVKRPYLKPGTEGTAGVAYINVNEKRYEELWAATRALGGNLYAVVYATNESDPKIAPTIFAVTIVIDFKGSGLSSEDQTAVVGFTKDVSGGAKGPAGTKFEYAILSFDGGLGNVTMGKDAKDFFAIARGTAVVKATAENGDSVTFNVVVSPFVAPPQPPEPIVPVTSIKNAVNTGDILAATLFLNNTDYRPNVEVGDEIDLAGFSVNPAAATNDEIVWTVTMGGDKAEIDEDDVLVFEGVGTAVLEARIEDGRAVDSDFVVRFIFTIAPAPAPVPNP